MITAIIVDDEQHVRNLLRMLLQAHCPEVTVVDECGDLPQTVKSIRKHNPNIVFLDIEMPGHSGLELLDFFNPEEINFSIIFTTAYSQYAIQAFDLSAVGYLLKPIKPEALKAAVARYRQAERKLDFSIAQLRHNLSPDQNKRITLATKYKTYFVNINDIVYIKGDGAYSEFWLESGEKILVSKNLKHYEDVLRPFSKFVRISKQHIVNKDYITQLTRSGGTQVLLKNNTSLPVSPEKDHLLFSNP